MSEIERKWWFFGPISVIAVFLAIMLLSAAGLPVAPRGAYWWMVFILCFVGIKRTLSLLTWFALLLAAPSLVGARR